MKKSILLFALLLPLYLASQFGVGQWRDHLPYGESMDLCDGGDIIYAATPYAVFGLDKRDNSINRLSKVEGLAESEVSSIAFDKTKNVLVIGYLNGNLDLFFDHKTVVNVADIKNSSILGSKSINSIYFWNDKVYLACGFGIVVIDIDKKEVKETYIIGEGNAFKNVQDVVEVDGVWYAATTEGIYTADSNSPFLVSFESWEQSIEVPMISGDYRNIEVNAEKIYLFVADEDQNRIFFRDRILGSSWEEWTDYTSTPYTDIFVDEEVLLLQDQLNFYAYDTNHDIIHNVQAVAEHAVRGNTSIRDSEGIFWIADKEAGLIGENFIDRFHVAKPQGPFKRTGRKMDAYNNNIWIASGGIDASYTSLWNGEGAYGLVDGQWSLIKDFNFAVFPDMMDVAINPLDNSEVYIATWHNGLVRVKDNKIANVFNETNSTLQVVNFENISRVAVGAVTFDKEGNLWFSAHEDDEVLHLRTAAGEFVAYDLAPFYDESDYIVDILASQRGYVYLITRDNGLLALDHKGTLTNTSDDVFKRLTTDEGNGALPSERMLSIEEDLDGELWVGTDQGPTVFYSQEAIFSDENFDSQQIFITQDGNVQILLATEGINAIEIDGGNRKWIGTMTSGVYLLSPDGLNQLEHFTAANSPLLADGINDIVMNHGDGEVFIATEKGIIGYRNDASNFYEEMKDNIKIFPNPVRPEFDGLISIDNLSKDADIKISDISGNVIYQTTANGGRATWDGTNFSGDRVSTGVYIVFAATDDGSSKAVSKIAFIN